MTEKTVFAFISYNHNDVKWSKWLRKRLEWYRLPSEISNGYSDSRFIRPVFRDRDALTGGVLTESLRQYLEASKFLIVICSPYAAKSQFVSNEIQEFIDMGRFKDIIPFIVDGEPQDYTNKDITHPLMGECYPLALRRWNTEHPKKALLGISVTDDGKTDKQRAFIRLVAYILGMDFDTLWQRHKRFIKRVAQYLSILAVITFLLAYWFMMPVKTSVTLLDEMSRLPSMESGELLVNGCKYSFSRPDTTIHLNPLPGYFRLFRLPMTIRTNRYYKTIYKDFEVGCGISQHFFVQMHRDSTFAIYAGHVYDGNYDEPWNHPIPNAVVILGNHTTLTDDKGHFRIALPLEEQAKELPIRIKKDDYKVFIREEEVANDNLSYLLVK